MAKRRARAEELEPRVLLSGDLAGALALPAAWDAGEEPRSIVEPFESREAIEERETRHELVFVDAGVDDWETLVDDLLVRDGDGSVERRIEVVLLDSERDGLTQIAEALASQGSDLDAVHVVSHGTDQGIQLGATWLDGARLASQSDVVAGWADALSADADLLLYGCNLGASSEGKALAESLARLTGADVAASIDRTGAAALGGDWELELTTGVIETQVAFGAEAQGVFTGVLEGTAIWAENGNDIPRTSEFDGVGFGPETDTILLDEWEVIAGAEAPTRDEKIVLGIDASGTLSGQIWDGATWSAIPVFATGLSPETWAFDVAYSSQSGDALIAWSDPAGGVSIATWNGSLFSAPLSLGPPVGATPTHLELAADPGSDEIMLVGSVAGFADFALVWDGSAFVDGRSLVASLGSSYETDIDVAYEAQTGRAMIVYGDGTSDARYQVYDGSTWTGGTISRPNGPAGEHRFTELATDPTSNRIVMAGSDDFNTAWVSVWDGSAWEPSLLVSNNSQHADRQNVAVAFESTSGEAIVAYTFQNQSDLHYRRWIPGGGWQGEEFGPTFSDHLDALTLDADPDSDALMLSVVEQDREVSFTLWDGDSWGVPNVVEADSGTNRGQPFLFLYDQGPALPAVPVDSLWVTTQDPLVVAPGPFSAGDLIRFGEPNLVLEPGTTSGTATTAFDVELFSAGTNIDALHFVSRDIQVGASGFQLLEGDLLLSVEESSAQFVSVSAPMAPGFTNDLTVAREDVFVFRPDVAGNYASGTFARLLVDPIGDPITGISLIEADVRVGDADLQAGDFLFTRSSGGTDDSIFLFETLDVGALTGGTERLLLDGQDAGVDLSDKLTGIDVVEERSLIGGRILEAGTLLLTFESGGTAGSNALPLAPYDAFALTVTETTWIAGAGNGQATASLLAEAGDVPFTPTGGLDGLTLGASGAVLPNTAPVLNPLAPTLTAITEDDLTNAGDLVSDIVGGSVSDPDAFAAGGIAITGLSSGNGSWEADIGTGWVAVGAVSESSALLLRDSDRIRFVPDGENADAASFDFRAWDQTSGSTGELADTSLPGGTSAFSLATDTASIVVSAVNDAPVLDALATPVLDDVVEDAGAPSGAVGTLVSDLVDLVGGGGLDNVGDVDAGAVAGLALVQSDEANGTWHYSTDDGVSWALVGAVTPASARLLAADGITRVYFEPDPEFNGTVADAVTFAAWDGSAGANGALANSLPGGGISSFSTQTDTADINVIAANDAPVLVPSAPTLTPISEDELSSAGDLVSSLLGSSVSDADVGDPQGIAITALNSGNGSWEYSTDGGGVWTAMGPVSDASARLLRATDLVRFVPDGENADNASFDFRAWDQTAGTAGALADVSMNGGATAFSAAADTASIAVSAVNDAPLLDASGTMTLTDVTEDDPAPAGDTVAAIVLTASGDRITDVDAGDPEGFAVVGVDDSNGSWEYSTDGGGVWTAFGAVSDSAAVLLNEAARIRFVPGVSYAGPAGDLSFRAWDQSTGSNGQVGVDVSVNGGTTAFSVATETATLSVISQNDAPVLTPSAPSLPPITEDQTGNSGAAVSTLVGASITDADLGAVEGIAITGLSSGNGSWEYSTDGGSVWTAVPLTVADTAALLLRAGDRVRFIPDGQNADSASFDFRAWDQSSGAAGSQVDTSVNGGTSAYSTATDTASITVSAVNDAPVLTPSAPALTGIAEDDVANAGDPVSALLAGSVSDVDLGALTGIAITGTTPSNGSWEYSTDGGTVWSAVGAVSDASALLLRATDLVRFVPDGQNADSASFDFRAWDQSSGAFGTLIDASTNGGTTAYSTATDTASITVSAVNDAPVLDASGTMTLTDVAESDPSPAGDTVAAIVGSAGGDRITDVDAGDPEGIAVVSVDDSNGSWQYSTDGGSIWTAFGPVSDTAAVLLDVSARVRFVPAVGYLGSAGDLDFRAWDQSMGASGQAGVDASANGATTAFSVATETASLNVVAQNFAPVLTPSGPSLTSIDEDAVGNGGDLVADLVLGGVSDLNLGSLEGIAVTSLSSGNGTWQYSTNAGGSWAAVGGVSGTNALLLRDVDRLRFVPDARNADSASFDFRAWDQTTGSAGSKVDASATGGTTSFSAASDTASITVLGVNDAPTVGDASIASVDSNDTNPPGAAVSSLFGGSFSDVDGGSGLGGVAVIGNSVAAAQGLWQYSSDGGSNWFAIGNVGDNGSALVLSGATRLRFLPLGASVGGVDLQVRGLDDAYTGAYSSTGGGSETRANVNASANGGTTSIAGNVSNLTTIVLDGALNPDDLEDLEEPEEPPETIEDPPPVEETTAEEPGDPLGPPVPGPGTGGATEPVPSGEDSDPASSPPVFAPAELPTLVTEGLSAEIRDDRVEGSVETNTRSALDVLRDIYLGRSSIGADALTQLIFRGDRDAFLGQLDAASEDAHALSTLETRMVGSTIAVTSGLSVGYVLWLTRGGLLIASLLSSLPAWRLIDPIPILTRLGLDEESDEDESLGSIVDAEDGETEGSEEEARSLT